MNKDADQHELEPEIAYVSKSQKKRDALALQDLGKTLMQLNPEKIRTLPLPEYIQKALIEGRSMRMGALKRQIQYVGKLLRQEEDEIDLVALKALLQNRK